MTDPFLPAVGSLYWVQTTILPPGDPDHHRVAAVLSVPPTTAGTIAVALGSGAAPGRFLRRVPVQARLWTTSHVSPIGPLDGATFATLVEQFGL